MVAENSPTEDLSEVMAGSAEAFGRLAAPYRRELLVHCYRMLGSVDDAEDAVQDALTRAWDRRSTFQRAISFRAWLYRIATNACLDAIERRKRALPGAEDPAVLPIPDDYLDEASAGPEARYDSHESVSLAFLTVLQLLPPRQRAVLILRDVLGLRAAEVAELTDLTVPAVNSALHRARETVSSGYGAGGGRGDAGGGPGGTGRAAGERNRRRSIGDPALRSLLERYVRAWESADVAGLVALLRHDAVVSMPPGISVAGAAAIGAFLAESVLVPGRRIRLTPVRANGGPAHLLYSSLGDGRPLTAYAVVIAEADNSSVVRISAFAEPGVIALFGLPGTIDG
jgi:RNA polymerase sigma-70 factor, ECF subfamily